MSRQHYPILDKQRAKLAPEERWARPHVETAVTASCRPLLEPRTYSSRGDRSQGLVMLGGAADNMAEPETSLAAYTSSAAWKL